MTVYHVYRVLKPVENNRVTEDNTEWLATFRHGIDADKFMTHQLRNPLGYLVVASREG